VIQSSNRRQWRLFSPNHRTLAVCCIQLSMPPKAESVLNPRDVLTAILLAAAGGLLDAVVYLDHGHVFANAMTGNTIFMGIAAIQGDWAQVVRHLIPLCAFLCGVIAARTIHHAPLRHSALLVLALEAAALCGVGVLPPSFPQLAFTGTIAFVSAFQVATFRRVGRFTYNSTFITGNLRMVAEGTFDWLVAPRSLPEMTPEARTKGRAQALKLGAICLSFLIGALLGAFVSPRFPHHAILFAEPFLLATFAITLLRPQDAPQ
jgi:uncharacterized membrane protein YoaK (UPF0700 family)